MNRLILIFLFWVIAACSQPIAKPTPLTESDAGGSLAQWLANYHGLDISAAATVGATSESGTAHIQNLYEAGGYEAVREYAITRGFFISKHRLLPKGLYRIVERNEAALKISPVAVEGQFDDNGFGVFSQVGHDLYYVVSDFGYEKIGVYKDTPTVPEALLQGGWLDKLDHLTVHLGFYVPQSRMVTFCGLKDPKELRDKYYWALGKPLAELNDEELHKLSAPEQVRRLSAALLRTEVYRDCPYALLLLFARGAAPTFIFTEETPIASTAKLAFLGRVMSLCADGDGKVDLETAPACVWDILSEAKETELASLFRSLGAKGSDWKFGTRLLFMYPKAESTFDYHQFIEDAITIGVMHPTWLDLLGYKVSSLPSVAKATVERTYFHEGGFTSTSVNDDFQLPGKDFPLVLFALDSERFRTCSATVYWKTEWWRVCPNE